MNSHTNDPQTSKNAEKRTKTMRATHMIAVYDLLVRNPTANSTELATQAATDSRFSKEAHKRLYQIRRRLSDLKRDGKARIVDQYNGESTWEAI